MPIEGKDVLLTEKKDGIFILTINRPERENRFSPELVMRLTDAWEAFNADDDAVVAVLTAVGEENFCAGPDYIEVRRSMKGEIPKRKSLPWGLPRFYPYKIWKPIISAINGNSFAGGLMISNECDIRIAAEHALFGITETKWNLKGAWVGDLTRAMPIGQALEMALWSGDKYTAQRMYEIGWLNRVVPKEKLMDEAMSWAYRMLELAPTVVQNFKQIIYHGLYEPTDRTREFALALEANLVNTHDTREGIDAMLENRKSHYDGKKPKAV